MEYMMKNVFGLRWNYRELKGITKLRFFRNMGFNESGEYKKTFIGSGVGTGSMQVLQGVEFENLIHYHPARDREQHLAWELFGYREDSNEAAFAVAAVEKIYAHESLTFNDTVACEVISKWKAGLKDYMDARSDVYVLSNGCKKCSDDNDGYYWESTPGVCDVKKNDVGMLDKFDRGLQTDVQKKIWLKGLMTESGYELSLVVGITTGALVKGGFRFEVPAHVEGAAYRMEVQNSWVQTIGPGVETGVHGVHDEKRVWFEVELQGAQGDHEAEVFQRIQPCLHYLLTMSPLSMTGFKTPIDIKLGNKLWRLDDVTSKVLQGVEFEVEPQEDLTFEVEPHGNVDHVVGLHEVQTQNLIYYHLARDREQHLA
ncbi:hypothetical protein Tco_0097218 [Tanacetum coccineum]